MTIAATAKPRIRHIKDPASELRAAEERYRRVLEAIHEGMCLLDADSRIVHANRRLAEMLGWAEEELVGRLSFDLLQAGSAQGLRGPGTNVDLPLRRRDGGTLWANVSAAPAYDDDGHAVGLMALFTDVTQRRESEEALRRSEARYRALIENSNDVILVLDPAGRVTYQSPSMERLVGHPADCVGQSAFDNLHPEDLSDVQRGFARLLGNPRMTVALAGRFKHPDGTWHAVEGTGTNLLHEPAIGGLVVNFRDVTDRNLATQRARRAAQQIEQLTADAIVVCDAAGRVLSWNHGAEKIFGWTQAEVLGRVLPAVEPDGRDVALRAIKRAVEKGESTTAEVVRFAKNGRVVQALCSWSPVPLEDGEPGVLAILKDIGEHKHVTAQLREQAKSLAVLRERERIAMDLHDGVIQSLYGVTLSLGALRRQANSRPEKGSAVLGQSIEHLTDIIQGIRDYIYDLRRGLPEEGDLASGLSALAEQLQANTGLKPRLEMDERLAGVAPATAAIVLYIAQEALSNVARHADARQVSIEARRTADSWSLVIRDDGRGFDPAKRGRRRGDGLRNMRERARGLGGSLTVRSKAGAGTRVRLVFS